MYDYPAYCGQAVCMTWIFTNKQSIAAKKNPMAKKFIMSTRFKITLGLIGIALVSYVILAFFTGAFVNRRYIEDAQERVTNNLKFAHEIYDDNIWRIERTLRLINIRKNPGQTFAESVRADLAEAFENTYIRSRIQLLTFVDTDGHVVFRAHNPEVFGDNLSDIPVIRNALLTWESSRGTVTMDKGQLLPEGEDLIQRARIQVIATPNSLETKKDSEERGMFLMFALPVSSQDGRKKLGVLLGGYLINNSIEIVDRIKSMIFQNQRFKGKDVGTATIFFDDVRISTNVVQKDRSRAVGSRLSKEVYRKVFDEGQIWADRAFVVNDWYLTAYEPIKDPDGRIIGALYVGLLEEPFKNPEKVIMLFFLVAISLTTIVMVIGMFFYTKVMMRPIECVIRTSKKIMGGELSARTRIRPSGEMGLLCSAVDQMADSIEKNVNKLQEESRKQIMQSEKLASVGRLAAGVAHEINNPLTGVLTFAHFLKDKHENDESDQQDINIIIQETTRVREIIRGLLDFARQTPAVKTPIEINEVIQNLLKLIKGQKEFKNITIVENYKEGLLPIRADKNQLQQVFLNLLLNAGEAIAGPGKITITTFSEEEYVIVRISDTGCGISEDDLNKIFDPFFTTKPVGKGTGLGLSVSYGIIQQHGGTIKCDSILGEGTTFLVILPADPDK
jgi:two-component system, NtrC family, sensor kinase